MKTIKLTESQTKKFKSCKKSLLMFSVEDDGICFSSSDDIIEDDGFNDKIEIKMMFSNI